jgi:signal transduction histidine kinase
VKRALSLLVIYFLLAFSSLAQINIDSLRYALKSQDNDSNKVKTYLQFFYTDLYYTDLEEVIHFTKKAMQLSRDINFIKGEVEAYNSLGYIYRLRSSNDSAFNYFNKAKLLSERENYTVGLLDAYIGLGNTYNQLSKWQEAIIEFKKAEEVALSGDNLRIAASANNNMGNISLAQGALKDALNYYQKAADIGPSSIKEVALVNIGLVHIELNNSKKAKSYLLKAKEMTEDSKNWYALAFIYQHLGSLEKSDGKLQEALDYYQLAMNSYESIDERQHYSEVLTSVAAIYYDQQEYEKALSAYQESLKIQKEIEHFTGWCNSLHGMGRVYMTLGNEAASESALLEAANLADIHELLTTKDDIALTLSRLYKQTGQFEKALKFHELHKQLSDSLLNKEKSEQIAEMEARFENKQKQQEIDLLSAENEIANLNILQQTNFRNYVIIIAFILAVLVAVAYNRVQVKARINKKLQELDYLKTSFFTNISHEFRTPLTLILNPVEKILKSQQSAEIRNDLLLVQRNGQRLLELTKQLLDLSKLEAGKLMLAVSKHKLPEFLKTIIASFESLALSKNIQFTTDLSGAPETAYFDQDNLQKILTNLLANAFKFTPDGGLVTLEVSLENSFLQVLVSDSGPGISPEQ